MNPTKLNFALKRARNIKRDLEAAIREETDARRPDKGLEAAYRVLKDKSFDLKPLPGKERVYYRASDLIIWPWTKEDQKLDKEAEERTAKVQKAFDDLEAGLVLGDEQAALDALKSFAEFKP